MFTKRRLRFSIGAMLVLMTGVAVLLNHEVQHAKAIETTVKKIEGGFGSVNLTRRAKLPKVLTNILPRYWNVKIISIDVTAQTDDRLTPLKVGMDPLDLKKTVELGALDNLSFMFLRGNAIDNSLVVRLCSSNSMHEVMLGNTSLSTQEVEQLESTFPQCRFRVLK